MLGSVLGPDEFLRAGALWRPNLSGEFLLKLSLLILKVFLTITNLTTVGVDSDTRLSLLGYHLR